jgi:hypothetical protein
LLLINCVLTGRCGLPRCRHQTIIPKRFIWSGSFFITTVEH